MTHKFVIVIHNSSKVFLVKGESAVLRLAEVTDGLEIAIGGEDFRDRFKQVDTSLSVELDGCRLSSTVYEAE